MFLWATLPDGISLLDLFERSIQNKVAFVPGTPFYTDAGGSGSLRLNYSNADPDSVIEGIRRPGEAMKSLIR